MRLYLPLYNFWKRSLIFNPELTLKKGNYSKIKPNKDDKIDIIGLTSFEPETQLKVVLNHSDGTIDDILVNHTFNQNQIEWFKAGSALNLIAAQSIES